MRVKRVLHPELKPLHSEHEEQEIHQVLHSKSKASGLDFVAGHKENQKIVPTKHSGFFAAVYEAYANHHPLRLTPDQVWLSIVQGIVAHVDVNAEALRSKIVDFQGKKALEIQVTKWHNTPEEWQGAFSIFNQKIGQNVKADASAMLFPKFSTTTELDTHVINVAIMDCFKHYFEYRILMGCGLPSVILTGELEDWVKLRQAAEKALKFFEIDFWLPKLLPILDEFVKTYRGEVNVKFWDCIYQSIPNDSSGRLGAYDPVGRARFHGWIINFYPYFKIRSEELKINQMMKELENYYTHHDQVQAVFSKRNPTPEDIESLFGYILPFEEKWIPCGVSSAEIIFVDENKKEYKTTANAGFFGYKKDSSSGEITPTTSWYLGLQNQDGESSDFFRYGGGEKLRDF